MARRREAQEPRRTRTIVQRVVVPIERAYESTRRRAQGLSGADALKYLAWSAGTGVATHFAARGLKRLVGAAGDEPKHDPLWVSAPLAAATIIAATQLRGTAQVAALGAAVDSTGQLVNDAYQHFRRPAGSQAPQLPPAQQQNQPQQGPQRRNATADQLAAAYEASRRELARQQLNARAQAQAQQQAAMYGAYGAVPMY
jgi:hypothetical protein